jgi:hypothetical protein
MKGTKEKENPNKNNVFDKIIFKLTSYIFFQNPENDQENELNFKDSNWK